jgi:ABC-2 type transport system permease protein
MSAGGDSAQGKTLRRLFLTLFLRGRTSRGLQRDKTPKSVGAKLRLILFVYTIIGFFMALPFQHKPLFLLSIYLHSTALVFLGMLVAASAGEILFNKDESEILMHRPVTTRALLWAKITVLVQISLWLSLCYNIGGLIIGTGSSQPAWAFAVVHIISTAGLSLFCTGCVVVLYQLCLRSFGREKLDSLMTTVQVLAGVTAVAMGQVVPRVMMRLNIEPGTTHAWWLNLMPPVWFAGLDDAFAGSGERSSWILGAGAVGATVLVMSLAFGKLARDYESGLQMLNEAVGAPHSVGGRRNWLERLMKLPLLSWWLRDSITRASFRLTAAYLTRDRDVKLRVYPGLAPMLIMPILFLVDESRGVRAGPSFGILRGFSVAFAGYYLGLVPYLALNLVRFSQQWPASDLFRIAPMAGPGQLCEGARKAVLSLLTFPLLIVFGAVILFLHKDATLIPLMLPGLMLMPLFAMAPCLGGKAVPLSTPGEEYKAAGRGLTMWVVMMLSALLALGATACWNKGYFALFLIAEALVGAGAYYAMRENIKNAPWPSME